MTRSQPATVNGKRSAGNDRGAVDMPMGGGGGGKDASFMRRAFQNKVNAHPLSILWAPCRAQVLTVSKSIFATVILQPIILRQII